MTIDGTSNAVTRRTGDPTDGKCGTYSIPAGKQAVLYALGISSGGADRQIDLISSTDKYELSVPGGSSTYQRLESEPLPAGTYSVERAASSGNVRLAVIVLKFTNEGGTTGMENAQPSAVSAQKIIREGQLLILRDGKIYTITGQSL